MALFGVVSLTELAEVRQGDLEVVIARVAERQHGAITLRQLEACGLSPAAVRNRARVGRLRRLHRGIYATTGMRLSQRTHWMAAALACGPGAVLSHQSAAALWGIRESAAAVIDVSAPRRTGQRRHGLRVHRTDRLDRDEHDRVAGIPCTTVARTLVDLASVLPGAAFEYALHRAQSQRLVRRNELADLVARRPGSRGAPAVRKALSLQIEGEDEVRSRLERRMARIAQAADMPRPRINYWIDLPDGPGVEVDFAWPQWHLVVEVDSRRYHSTDRAFENDRRRDRRLAAAGWRVVRFTEADLRSPPLEIAFELRRIGTAGFGVVSQAQ